MPNLVTQRDFAEEAAQSLREKSDTNCHLGGSVLALLRTDRRLNNRALAVLESLCDALNTSRS